MGYSESAIHLAFCSSILHTAEKEAAGFGVRCDALKKCKGIAYSVRCGSRQLRRVEKRIN
jgi:hypothetical protein